MQRVLIILAGIAGASGVALGAFGAHGLSGFFAANPGAEDTFRTGVQYHLVHAVALLGAAWAVGAYPSRWTRLAGIGFAVGIVLFSGALYALSLLGLRWMGAVAPLGGAALIGGWLALTVAAVRGER